jgi:hypothetical protein
LESEEEQDKNRRGIREHHDLHFMGTMTNRSKSKEDRISAAAWGADWVSMTLQ